MSAVGSWIKRWIHWGDRGTLPLCDNETYVKTPLIRCVGKEMYARRLASIVAGDLIETGYAPATPSLDYFSFTRPYDSNQALTNFDYWLKKLVFEQKLGVRKG